MPVLETLREAFAAAGNAPLLLRNARIPLGCAPEVLPNVADGLVGADIEVSGSKIGRVTPPGELPVADAEHDLQKSIVWPCPVDCHTHLNKGLVWPRSPNPTGTFDDASEAARSDAARYQTAEDFRARAQFALETAYAHGTCAIRTHADAGNVSFDYAFSVLSELAEEWKDRIILQIGPFSGLEENPDRLDYRAERAATRPERVFSAFLQMFDGLDEALDQLIARARRYDLSLDFHADENLNPDSHCLKAIARAVLRNKFEAPVLVGHCCALSVQPDDVRERTLDLVAEADLRIVSLPLCNAYLMDRRETSSPRLRGFAPVHEIKARGIPIALASDNIRDSYYAYGDLDLPELFRDAVKMMHLDHPFGDWGRTVTTTAAECMGLEGAGQIVPGNPADLIFFTARTCGEFVSRPQQNRLVMRSGHFLGATRPEYDQLDHLEGMAI